MPDTSSTRTTTTLADPDRQTALDELRALYGGRVITDPVTGQPTVQGGLPTFVPRPTAGLSQEQQSAMGAVGGMVGGATGTSGTANTFLNNLIGGQNQITPTQTQAAQINPLAQVQAQQAGTEKAYADRAQAQQATAQQGQASQATAQQTGATQQAQSQNAQADQSKSGKINFGYTQQLTDMVNTNNQNPYLAKMVAAAIQPVSENYRSTVIPTLQSGAQAAGRYGGSANDFLTNMAATDYERNIGDLSTKMYGTAYENDMNRALQAMQLGGQLGTSQAGYDTQSNLSNAQLGTQANLQNAQLGTGVSLANANNDLTRQLQNSQLGTQAAIQNAQLGTQASLQNALMGTNTALQNAQLGTGTSQFNAGLGTDVSKLNANLGSAANIYNAGAADKAGQFNATSDLTRLLQNAGYEQNTGQFNATQDMNAQGANIYNQLAGVNAGNATAARDLANAGTLYAMGGDTRAIEQAGLNETARQGEFNQNAPWDQANRWINSMNAASGLGNTVTSTDEYNTDPWSQGIGAASSLAGIIAMLTGE
jgi:hypothetical protein